MTTDELKQGYITHQSTTAYGIGSPRTMPTTAIGAHRQGSLASPNRGFKTRRLTADSYVTKQEYLWVFDKIAKNKLFNIPIMKATEQEAATKVVPKMLSDRADCSMFQWELMHQKINAKVDSVLLDSKTPKDRNKIKPISQKRHKSVQKNMNSTRISAIEDGRVLRFP